jgi:transcriptional regulator with XRE-family HTH domain
MPRNEKLLIGPRIARFRKTLGLTQSRMAEDLGISTSYLNLMERNQRSLSAKVLLRMAEIYDFDIASFTGAGDAHLVAEVYETLRDPIFKGDSLSKNEAEDLVNVSPSAARSLIKLYGKHRDTALRDSENTNDKNVELL